MASLTWAPDVGPAVDSSFTSPVLVRVGGRDSYQIRLT
jgi:hypothetical protein